MKHRRGIDLAPFSPATHRVLDAYDHGTIQTIKEWEVLGAKCSKCAKTTWLDKHAIMRRFGNQDLRQMGSRLVCGCGNRDGNRLLIGRLARD